MLKKIAQPIWAQPPRAGAIGAAALQESEDKETIFAGKPWLPQTRPSRLLSSSQALGHGACR